MHHGCILTALALLSTMRQLKYKKRFGNTDELDQFTLDFDELQGRTRVHKRVRATTEPDRIWYYVGFAGDLGFTIAVPIAGGALLGLLIDRQWSTYPKATLCLLLLGIIISMVGFIRTVRELMRRKK